MSSGAASPGGCERPAPVRGASFPRRAFLRAGAMGTLALALGPLASGCSGSPPSVEDPQVLSPAEIRILDALARVVLPPGGAIPYAAEDVRVSERLDEQLTRQPDEIVSNVRAALWLIEFSPWAALDPTRFSRHGPEAQRRTFEALLRSDRSWLRQAAGGLKQACLFAYYTSPIVWSAMHYPGPLVP